MAALTLLLRSATRPGIALRPQELHNQAVRRIHLRNHLNRVQFLGKNATNSDASLGFLLTKNRGLFFRVDRTAGGDAVKNEVGRRIRGGSGVEVPALARGTASAAVSWAGGGLRSVIGPVSGGGLEKRVAQGVVASIKLYAGCYWELSKARLSMLVVTTAGLGFVMGSGDVVDWAGLGWTSLGTMLAACSANAFNQVMEIANDARMKRTMRRPLPSGRMGLPHAAAFAVTAGVAGVAILAYKTNAMTAELGAANLLLYTLVYTPLKQIHWVNTWVGAVVGAIPPLMGWAAAAGQLNAGGWILGAALYFWQIPHFMALAFLCRRDYAAGRYKMLSLRDVSGHRTALAALRNCVYLMPLGFLAQDLDMVSGHFGLEMLVLSAGFGATATSFYFSPTSITARRLFRASLLYLPIVMTAMIYQRIPNPNLRTQESLEDSLKKDEATEYHRQLGFTNLKGTEKNMKHTWSYWPDRPPIASLSAAPFPFLPAPEDRTL